MGTGKPDYVKTCLGYWARKSAFLQATKRYGCWEWHVYNRMFLPFRYTDEIDEYWKLRNGVVIWDVGVERQIEITGPDALTLAEKLTPRNLRKCRDGQCRYAPLCYDDGGIVNDPVLLRFSKSKFWLSMSNGEGLGWIHGVAREYDVQVREAHEIHPVQIQGPKSRAVMRELLGEKILGLQYYHFIEDSIDSIPVVISRTGWTGELGYEIYLKDPDRADDLWELIMAKGKRYDIAPAGPNDIRRVEAGILDYGKDMTDENNLFEIGMGWAIDFTKDFIGKEALLKLRDEGIKRRIMGFEFEGDPAPSFTDPLPVFNNGDEVGHVTIMVYSPFLEKNIGYTWVPAVLAKPGTKVDIAIKDRRQPARIVELPFYDREKKIPKS